MQAQRPLTPAEVADRFLRPLPRNRVWPEDFLSADRLWIDTPSGRLAAAAAGSGPGVLLVHGWEGRSFDMAALARRLVAIGRRVVTLDLPAHGESEGTQASLPACADALLKVVDELGPIHGVIAHSIGCGITVEALGRGCAVDRVVLIAAPAHYIRYVRHFARRSGLDEKGTDAFIQELARRGVDALAYSIPSTAQYLRQAALFLNSSSDRIISLQDAIECAGAWRGARVHEVSQWGHLRMLQAPEVVATACEFVSRELKAGP